jgi:hypothetical protein
MLVMVAIVLMMMVMTQQREPLKKEKHQEPRQEGGCHGVDIHIAQVKALREQMQEGCAQQHTRREAHHAVDESRQSPKRDDCRQENTQEGCSHTGQQNRS